MGADMKQKQLFDAERVPTFDGVTFDFSQDHTRLTNSIERVAAFMGDGRWRTLQDISRECACSESGASARLRDLRKPKFQERFGSLTVESMRAGGGLWFYRVSRNTNAPTVARKPNSQSAASADANTTA